MSSGIDWLYTIRAPAGLPPIRYCVGRSWASGEASSLAVGLVAGLAEVRMAYARLPGLTGLAKLWTSRMTGSTSIAETATRRALDRARGNRDAPMDIGTAIRWGAIVCGEEIARHAGLALSDDFDTHWAALAVAADEWPRSRWGRVPQHIDASSLIVSGRDGPVDAALRERVLRAADRWSMSVDLAAITHRECAALAVEFCDLWRASEVA